jgi:hypothetical protein
MFKKWISSLLCLLEQPSAIFAGTDTAALLIWLSNPYLSS